MELSQLVTMGRQNCQLAFSRVTTYLSHLYRIFISLNRFYIPRKSLLLSLFNFFLPNYSQSDFVYYITYNSYNAK